MRAPIQIRRRKSSAIRQLFQQFPPELGERIVARAEDQDAVAGLCFVQHRGAAFGAGRQMHRVATIADDIGDPCLAAGAAVDGAAAIADRTNVRKGKSVYVSGADGGWWYHKKQ